MLYVCLSKALYGLLQSALLFYRKLQSELEAYGFTVNPYDPYVANKMINGKQMTVTWYVDDLKISHMDSNEVTKCIEHFKKIYGDRMTVHCGKVHEYLGMDLDFSSAKVLKIGMIKYVKKILEEFSEETNQRLLRLLQRIYLMSTKTTRTRSFLRNKHWRFTVQHPNFYSTVHVLGLIHVLMFHFHIQEPGPQMKMTGVS